MKRPSRKLELFDKREKLENIKPIPMQSEENIPLPDNSVDIFFIFDVLYLVYNAKLFPEKTGLLKQDGVVCVNPNQYFAVVDIIKNLV